MASSFGGTVKLTGESEYRRALKEITSNLKEVSSELKLTNVQFSSGDKTIKETKTSYSNMNSTIQEQKDKISSLRSALVEAEKEYGSNNEKVKTFKTQLNNAEAQLTQMESATNKSNKELKEMKNGFDEAGQGSVKFADLLKANVFGDMITSGIKALGSAIKEVGTAMINVGKQALDSYADYEQLVGGIQTLFKDSAGTVESYANNAYQTAGLSANEYMETVTSFSASLLQSLGNDTEKGAEYANRAIIDMSDNANKMGTDISMIQNAYQGFAKQNYTMLDNLKLGYGGTKEEMQRLIQEASNMTEAQKTLGVTVDGSSMSFANIVNAISVVQQELGIAGTTSKEASTTIQGSVASMKSAWQNMLTGIATGSNETIGDLVNNLTDSVITAGQNILPRVQEIVNGIVAALPQIVQKINENLPSVLQTGTQILQSLISGIETTFPKLMPMVTELITTLLNFVIENLPTIINLGVQMLLSLIQGISQSLPKLIPVALDAIMTIANNLLDNIDKIIDAGIELILALIEGIFDALPDLIARLPELIVKISTRLIELIVVKIPQVAVKLVQSLIDGLFSYWNNMLSKVREFFQGTIFEGLINKVTDMASIGLNLVQGLWNGIKNSANWLWNKLSGWCSDIFNNIKSFFGIHSPSKVFEDEIGTNLALGIGEGFSGTMKDVSKEMSDSIPTEFDVNSSINSVSTKSQFNLDNMTKAFITAIKNLNAQIVIDKDVAGRFVVSSVNEQFGKIYG